MEVVYVLNSLKKLQTLKEDEMDAVKALTSSFKNLESLEDVFTVANAQVTNFEGMPVFIARVSEQIRVVFTEKEGKIYILSLIGPS